MTTSDGHPAFLNLAVELQVWILLGLRLGDLTRCTRVCKALRSFITSEVALQYKMELDRGGMVDGPSRDVSLTMKLEKLRVRKAAWDTGFPLHTVQLALPLRGGCFPGGFFMYSERKGADSEVWRLHRPAWPELETSGGLEQKVALLTTHEGLDPALSASSRTLPCAINPEEDLVVFGRDNLAPDGTPYCVIYDISRHKIIDSPWISQLGPFDDYVRPPTRNRIQAVGDLLLWSRVSVFYRGRAELRVVNWKTGVIVWRSHWPNPGRCISLNPSHVLVVDHRGLFIYGFDPHASATTLLEWAGDNYLLHLAFPAFSIRLAEIFSVGCCQPGSRYFKSDRPFFLEDPDIAVLAVSFWCHHESLAFVIPIATINA
ncbi:hypothetical protein L226DRAFT_616448 [Lentinus tigrinus ALCF2SS1-7]|uniref:F-box domain-containing protein n=1 Tax=Lentinus tigrinus ALCF2SS1-6 TaxID=1328759 RepID=A0A5C2RTM4_9APHY|nr:hypothetical protein L227DRAFT_616050 [Lentinus tigrinus ALCF2SS1-6]RPD70046.1 hypothetical protein L226DRAFT_616448 [Lentinus tigrinus ALCF2SS1-7]